jgi:DNA-directed RNA polymerase specialized sigma24 family protein
MRREEHVDYFLVRDEHLAIHALLEQWARWVRVRPHGWQTAPMFRQYRSKAWQWHERVIPAPVNTLEALEVERAVASLPEKHRAAVRWLYVIGGGPSRIARDLAVSKSGLMELVNAGRQMLVNKFRQ